MSGIYSLGIGVRIPPAFRTPWTPRLYWNVAFAFRPGEFLLGFLYSIFKRIVTGSDGTRIGVSDVFGRAAIGFTRILQWSSSRLRSPLPSLPVVWTVDWTFEDCQTMMAEIVEMCHRPVVTTPFSFPHQQGRPYIVGMLSCCSDNFVLDTVPSIIVVLRSTTAHTCVRGWLAFRSGSFAELSWSIVVDPKWREGKHEVEWERGEIVFHRFVSKSHGFRRKRKLSFFVVNSIFLEH